MDALTENQSPVALASLSDHDLLAGGLEDQRAENAAAAYRLARLDEFRIRQEADHKARQADSPHFTLTPIQETVIEAGELWGYSVGRIRGDLRTVRTLKEHFPGIWALCLDGALDMYKASLVADAAKFSLTRRVEFAAFGKRITAWLLNGIPPDSDRPRLVNRTVKQLRNKLNYELNKLKPQDADERFKQAFKDRKAKATLGEDGIGFLGVTNSANQVQLADYRLTLSAKALRAAGDERTLEQLRADLAIALILGKTVINAGNGELEDEERDHTEAFQAVRTPKYARPIVNVTVPIQTLMGLTDHPGVLSGGTVIPGTLARMVATDPDSSWYRMLTDEHGQMVELSTKSYQPTPPIWRDVVARHSSCYRRNCTVPATEAELDHLRRWPDGETSTTNLGPGCKADHKGKHAEGFHVSRNSDSTLTFRTRAGFAHTTEAVEHPATDYWPDASVFESQFTATEILDAIHYQRALQAAIDASVGAELDEDDRWLLERGAA